MHTVPKIISAVKALKSTAVVGGKEIGIMTAAPYQPADKLTKSSDKICLSTSFEDLVIALLIIDS